MTLLTISPIQADDLHTRPRRPRRVPARHGDLIQGRGARFHLSPTVVGLPAVLVFALVVFVGRALWRARRRPPRVGAQAMHGLPAEILDWRAGAGHVRAIGERWQARGDGTFAPGETVEVASVNGLTLMVRRRPDAAAAEGEPP